VIAGVWKRPWLGADGCLIGAGTLRQHGDTCLIHRPQLLSPAGKLPLATGPIAWWQPFRACLGSMPALFDQGRWSAGCCGGRFGLCVRGRAFSRLLRLESLAGELRKTASTVGVGSALVLLGGARAGHPPLLAEPVGGRAPASPVCPVLLGGPPTLGAMGGVDPPQNWTCWSTPARRGRTAAAATAGFGTKTGSPKMEQAIHRSA